MTGARLDLTRPQILAFRRNTGGSASGFPAGRVRFSQDEAAFRAVPGPVAPARLLPSGDAYFLLQGAGRDLLVPDAGRRRALWTPRVWPGGLLAGERSPGRGGARRRS